jgi:hypothetical protein
MARQATQPHSIYEALNLYTAEVRASEPESKAYATLAQTQSALLRYVLPAMGFPAPKGKKITELEKQSGLEALKQVPLEKLQEAPELLKRSFASVTLSKGNQRIQRHTLNRFLSWCKSQAWWVIPASQGSTKKTEKQEKTKQILTTTRKKQKSYGLKATKGEQIPQNLQQELNSFYEFRINPPTEAHISSVKAETAKNDLKNIDLFFGWLHHHQMVPIDQLSLRKFIPVWVGSAYENVEQGDRLVPEPLGDIQEYIDWLQAPNDTEDNFKNRGERSCHTIINVLQTSIAVTKFLHHQQNLNLLKIKYEDLPEVQALRQEIRKIHRSVRDKPSVTHTLKQIPDWVEFLRLVEALRLECEPSFLIKNLYNEEHSKHSSRTLSAIALSLQRFLMVAFYAYLPLRSRVTYRYLNFFTSTDPEEVMDYLILNEGYLFLYDNIWWIKLFGPFYGSDRRRKPPILKVPNLTYSDKTSFYDYLSAWLIHYPDSTEGVEIGGLRACFAPQHSFVFTKKNGEFYEKPTDFTNVIRNASCRIIGKPVTPNAIRHMFTSYMQSQVYSEALIASLSDSIGYKNDDLRKIYSEQPSEAESELVQRLGID